MEGSIGVTVSWESYYKELEIRFTTGTNGNFVTTITRDFNGTTFYSAFLGCTMYHDIKNIIGMQYFDEAFEDLLPMTDNDVMDAYVAAVTETVERHLCYTKIETSVYQTPTICLKISGGKK